MRYDVYKMRQRDAYLLDVQNDLLDGLNTRVVVPLLPRDRAPIPAARLNPVLAIDGAAHVMATQFLAAVPRTELGEPVANLLPDQDRIVAALDMLFHGF